MNSLALVTLEDFIKPIYSSLYKDRDIPEKTAFLATNAVSMSTDKNTFRFISIPYAFVKKVPIQIALNINGRLQFTVL